MPALRLEVFDTVTTGDGAPQPLVEASALDEAKVASFEQGYSAGWEDAAAAQECDQTRIRADVARNLQSRAFTFQDARTHVLQAIRPLIQCGLNRLKVAKIKAGPMAGMTAARMVSAVVPSEYVFARMARRVPALLMVNKPVARPTRRLGCLLGFNKKIYKLSVMVIRVKKPPANCQGMGVIFTVINSPPKFLCPDPGCDDS